MHKRAAQDENPEQMKQAKSTNKRYSPRRNPATVRRKFAESVVVRFVEMIAVESPYDSGIAATSL
jgi:hypothetical protein